MAKQNQPVKKRMHPFFEVPPNVLDLVPDEELVIDNDEEDNDDTDPLDDSLESEELPAVPTNFTIVSATSRFGPDGSQIVDLIIEVEDVEDVIQYDVHVTKV